jgi:hypothetical protein
MEFLGDMGHAETCFGPFGDSVSVGTRYVRICTKRIIGLGIVLAKIDGHVESCSGHTRRNS